MTLDDQIQDAKKHIRQMKRINPFVFGEYIALKRCEKEFVLAQINLRNARHCWERLGK